MLISLEQQIVVVAQWKHGPQLARHDFATGNRNDRLDDDPRLHAGIRVATAKNEVSLTQFPCNLADCIIVNGFLRRDPVKRIAGDIEDQNVRSHFKICSSSKVWTDKYHIRAFS